MNTKHLHILALAIVLSAPAFAEGAPGGFADWSEPRWVRNLNGFEGDVRIEGLDFMVEAVAVYTYPNGTRGTALAEPDAEHPEVWRFTIPPEPDSGPGELTYYVEALYGMHGTDRRSSGTRRLPVSYAEELDITGDADARLLYPLPDKAYQVRYVPCCNIYGGMTYAERLTLNPEETAAGLPDTLLSDFVVLEPDGLSASTMGMYFDFQLGPEAFRGLRPEQIGLYEFVGQAWVAVQTYDVDVEAGKVSVHFPHGGTLVVGKKSG